MKWGKIIGLLAVVSLCVSCSGIGSNSVEAEKSSSAPTASSETTTETVDVVSDASSEIPTESTTLTIEKEKLQALQEAALVGCWHEAPGVAAGYGPRYVFFTNHEFVYFCSESDGLIRERSYAGTWKMADENLELTIIKKTVLTGGEEVPAREVSPSLVTKTAIKGGTYEKIILEEPEAKCFPIPEIVFEHKAYRELYPLKTQLDGKDYWKFNGFGDISPIYVSGPEGTYVDYWSFSR